MALAAVRMNGAGIKVLPPAILLAVPPSAWAANAPGGSGPSELIFVAQLIALMIIGRVLGEAMLRIGQPAVMGQLIAGLILGPSVLGALFPDWQHLLFPPMKEQKAMLDGIAQFGVLVLLLLTGMETDLNLVRQTGRTSAIASAAGIAVPFVCGVGLGLALPESMLPHPDMRLITSLFLGTALSIASVKIVATIIREMNFMRRTVGQVILASAIIDDTVGWMITAVIFSLALHGSIDSFSLAKSIIGTLVFMGVSLTIGRRAVFSVIRWVNDAFVSDFAVITAILVIMSIMSIITDLIGVHTVLGAFVAGILVGESPILTRHIDEQLRGLISAFFMPVFFGTAGLSADLTILRDPMLLTLTVGLIVIASVGKFGGAFAGSKFAGLTGREALALGTGMNAHGSTEVIVATIGLAAGGRRQRKRQICGAHRRHRGGRGRHADDGHAYRRQSAREQGRTRSGEGESQGSRRNGADRRQAHRQCQNAGREAGRTDRRDHAGGKGCRSRMPSQPRRRRATD